LELEYWTCGTWKWNGCLWHEHGNGNQVKKLDKSTRGISIELRQLDPFNLRYTQSDPCSSSFNKSPGLLEDLRQISRIFCKKNIRKTQVQDKLDSTTSCEEKKVFKSELPQFEPFPQVSPV